MSRKQASRRKRPIKQPSDLAKYIPKVETRKKIYEIVLFIIFVCLLVTAVLFFFRHFQDKAMGEPVESIVKDITNHSKISIAEESFWINNNQEDFYLC